MKKKMLHTKAVVDKAFITEAGVIDNIIGSSSVLDRMGDIIDQSGWDLTNFKENPVILWGHNVREERMPIGRAIKVWVQDKGKATAKLMFKVQFDLQDTFAAEVFRKIKDGFINTVSVGFLPSEWEELDPDNWFGGLKFLKQELLELSVVPVPANPEALIQLNSFAAQDKRFTPMDLKKLAHKTPTKEFIEELQAETKDDEPEDNKPEDEKPEDTKPEDTKPEDTKPEDVKPEDEKPEGEDKAQKAKDDDMEVSDDEDMPKVKASQFSYMMKKVWRDGYKAGDESDDDEDKAMDKPDDDMKVGDMKAGQMKALMDDCMGDMRPAKEEDAVEGETVKEVFGMVKSLSTQIKSGRVLSAKNESKVRDAVKLLSEVLSALDKADDEETPVEGEEPKDMPDEETESKKVIPYKNHGTAPESEAWDAAEEVGKADVKDLKAMCAWYDADDAENKGAYKLPHHKQDGYKAVWRGVAAAMAALMGARGGADIPEEERKGVYNHLAKHYKEFDKEAPDYKAIEDQVLAKYQDEIHALVLDREDKHAVRLLYRILNNQKQEKKVVEVKPEVKIADDATPEQAIKALQVLNSILPKLNSKK